MESFYSANYQNYGAPNIHIQLAFVFDGDYSCWYNRKRCQLSQLILRMIEQENVSYRWGIFLPFKMKIQIQYFILTDENFVKIYITNVKHFLVTNWANLN